MNRLNRSIFALGLFHVSVWLWAPVLARWQARKTLERYNSIDMLESMMNEFEKEMLSTYILSGTFGILMLISCALIYKHRIAGWHLWTVCLVFSLLGIFTSIASNGVSTEAVFRLIVLSLFSYASIRIYRGTTWYPWFHQAATHVK